MLRKIHLDFHTHPATENVGQGFDAQAFAGTLRDAHVNYITTPGKCHFGHVYYDADVATTHPHLADPQLFPSTVEACLERGIRVQAYWTLGLDATCAQLKPDWRQVFEDGSKADWGDYLHMCFASPYIDEVVIPELLECVERCPDITGFWFDICLHEDGAFYSSFFNQIARERLGKQENDLGQRWQLAREIIRERCVQIDTQVKQKLLNAENYFNSLVNPGESNHLGINGLEEVENPFLFHGPERMSTGIRWLRGQGSETIGLVSRFHGPWSDPGTLRTTDQMRFDVARTVALGSHVSMGDHRYPDGHLEAEVYQRLRPIYAELAEMELMLEQATPVREALLIGDVRRGPGSGALFPDFTEDAQHAARLLEEIGLQFDMVTPEDEWPAADLIIWPGQSPGDSTVHEKLKVHLNDGGAVLAMHDAIVGASDLIPARALDWVASNDKPSGDTASIGHVGTFVSDAKDCGPAGHFVRLIPELQAEPFAYLLRRPCRLIESLAGAKILAHRYLPSCIKPPFPSSQPHADLIVQQERMIYSASNLFAEDAAVGAPQLRIMIRALCDLLLPNRMVQHNAGPSVVAHLHQTDTGALLHLVQWTLDRRDKQVNTATQFPRLGPIEVSVCLDRPFVSAILQPGGQRVELTAQDGIYKFTVPSLHICQRVMLTT